jgi:8-oxo-dGTP pyrophosphatase MutT (NUDIX family)
MSPPDLIQKINAATLGGYVAQQRMEHDARKDMMRAKPEVPTDAKKAAVMALLVPKSKQNGAIDWHLVLIQRATYKGAHSGQLAFPGGSVEQGDVDLQATAVRETYEEIGVAPSAITVVRPMTDIYIPVSNFLVQPFIGVCSTPPTYKAQVTEVVEVLEIPFSHFKNIENQGITDLAFEHFTLKNVPYYNIDGRKLWGATAMMVAELLEIIKL